MASKNVLFYKATKAKFDKLVEKNPLAIYFVEDIPAIYVGDVLFAVGAETTSTLAGLMSPEYKAKIDSLVESNGSIPSEELEAIRQELASKANATDVYSKEEVDKLISEITVNFVTNEEFIEVQNNVSNLETKVETSTDNVGELQTIIEQNTATVTELQTLVEQKVDTETVELLETELKTYVDTQIKEIISIDDGEI